ncbi:hypothetical protein HKX48_001612 [Thoreauomyces humboldtii]|nr:hypothetical protein HKX48_001612 [Thoreauomyces humboldtii]
MAAASLDKAPMPPINTNASSTASLSESTEIINEASQAAEPPSKPVAFEIPLDSLTKSRPASQESVATKVGSADARIKRLPSLGLPNELLKAKLANADARWKVGMQLDIDRILGDLDDHEATRKHKARRRRHGSKPELSSSARPKTRAGREEANEENAEDLKQRLLEREAHAEKNRQKELAKLQAKLARMDEHVRRVQERKKHLERTESVNEFAEYETSSNALAV